MIAKQRDTRGPVCVVDDDASVREAVGGLLRSAGLTVKTFGSAREFLASPRLDAPSCLVLDVELPGLSGLDLQQELVRGNVQVPIIFLTGHGDIPMSVRAIKAGALDFLTKPVDVDQLLGAIQKGIGQDHGGRGREQGVIGTSQSWRDVLAQAAKVAPAETTALLTGESGTGKEVVAHLIHRGSRRADGPFVALNCAALPEALLESELFGYEKGAFTGAVSARAGRLEQAAGGTLFLDEVGEMSPAVQAKVLRVLQEREFQRLGGTRMLKADVRVIAATNRDLKVAMTRGAFREDLYYRLHVFAIHLAPLRDRPEDILPLLEHFVEELGPVVLGRPAAGISREAREHFLAYSWPGNVRELRNAVERALILCEGGLINPEHLPWRAEASHSAPLVALATPTPTPAAPAAPPGLAGGDFPPRGVDLEEMERTLIENALKQAGHNRSKAARLLGLSRSKLYTRMERFGLV
ncbi:MAG TPA: sigma-54 dependent transcriptional regulator [Gemmatimonadales bacterium]|nr:sigma-54 dependent transcriptional regulator [Gemmatimonadales bacterium]